MTTARPSRIRRNAARTSSRWPWASCLVGIGLAILSIGDVAAETVVTKIDIGLPNVVALRIRGALDSDEILRLKSIVADLPTGKKIVAILESSGGLVHQGFALGRFFYDARIPTVITSGTVCASACTDAFLGGRDPTNGRPLRIISSTARLGFHNRDVRTLPDKQYSKAEILDIHSQMQSLAFESVRYFKDVEAPIQTIVLHSSTRPEVMNWVPPADLLDIGITVLNAETGRLVSPDNIATRIKR